MAMSYAFESNCQGATKYASRAYDIFLAAKDAFNTGELANELARICLESGDFDAAYNRKVLTSNAHNPTNAFARPLAKKKLGQDGGHDPLYPVSAVEPYVSLLRRAGAPVAFGPPMSAGHDTSWWPVESPRVDEFERRHPRDPLPAPAP